MTEDQLKDFGLDDIEDVLKKVEASFHIKLIGKELIHVKNFGELCDHITNKIQLADSNDCTRQQAFYKLRNAIAAITSIDKNTISPDTQLKNLLPRRNRHDLNNELEKQVGFKLNILRPPHWISWTLFILLLASFVMLFIKSQIGLSGLAFSITGFWVSNKLGKELVVQTTGEVAEKITREHYTKSRRNPDTFNKSEIENIIIELFSHDLALSKTALTREAKLYEQTEMPHG